MKVLEDVCAFVLGLLVFVDAVVIFRFWRDGWPTRVELTDLGDGRVTAEGFEIPFTPGDWVVTILFLGLQGGFGYLLWRLRRRRLSKAL
jgi:hypothetical protein